jgi:hypothetical protein
MFQYSLDECYRKSWIALKPISCKTKRYRAKINEPKTKMKFENFLVRGVIIRSEKFSLREIIGEF